MTVSPNIAKYYRSHKVKIEAEGVKMDFLMTKDVAKILNRSSEAVRLYANEGKLRAIRTPAVVCR